MNINYEYYHIFYYVAKYKNLSRAAEVLHNNQPNISRTVKLLEHGLGCNLILRSSRGISLTPEGELLYSHVKIMVEQIQLAEEKLQKASCLQNGIITVGVSETALRMLLLPVLNQFQSRYPDIRIRIRNHLTFQALESVSKKQVDFALVAGPIPVKKPLLTQSVLAFRDLLLCGTAFAYLQDTPLSLEEISEYPLICLGEDTMTYQFYDHFYRQHKQVLKPELEAATTDQILPMIRNNLGLGFVPPVHAQEALEKGEVCTLMLTSPIPEREIFFVQNENHPLSSAARELKKLLLAYANSLPES